MFFVTGFVALILWRKGKFGQLLNLGLRGLLGHTENADLHQVENKGQTLVRV